MLGWSPRRRLLGRSRHHERGYSIPLASLILGLVAVGLVALGQRFPDEVANARARLAGPVSSIMAMLQQPLQPLKQLGERYNNYVKLEEELTRLRAANDELEGWKWRALELERRLADLRALNRVVHEPGLDFVTASVRARSIGAAGKSILVGVGTRDGVTAGGGVLNARGLVGTTYEVGRDTTRVRFLNDARSRVVVSIGRGLVTAVAEGTGGQLLGIRAGGRSFDVAVGDEVISAGEVGGVPRGLRVGQVVSSAAGLRIKPYVDFERVEYVSLLLSTDHQTAEGREVREPARVAAQLGEDGEPVDPEAVDAGEE